MCTQATSGREQRKRRRPDETGPQHISLRREQSFEGEKLGYARRTMMFWSWLTRKRVIPAPPTTYL